MKKFYLLTKTLLVAVLLCVGASNVWGTATKVLFSQNYESATDASSWTSQFNSGGLSLVTGDVTYGNYIRYYGENLGGPRTAYSRFYSSSDFYSDYEEYTIEFDAAVRTSNGDKGNHPTELVVASDGYSLAGNAFFISNNTTNKNYLFLLRSGSTASGTGYYINGGSTEYTIANNSWFHVKLVVDVTNKEVEYTLTGAVSTSGTYTITDESSIKAKAMIATLGKGYYGTVLIDNISITTEVDEEVVSDPSIGDPVYAGVNRTVTITSGESSASNAVTTYYTIDGTDPSASNYEGSFTTASKDVTITSSCTLKAISISSTEVSSNVASRAITAGKITLNAPTFTKTAYSAGNYTVTIADNQSSLEFVPASTTIKYRVGSTGEYATYSTGVSVPEGSTLYAYVEATNYNNSANAEIVTAAIPSYPESFSQNYVGVVGADVTLSYDGTNFSNCIVSNVGSTYAVYSSDGTSASTNANIGFYVDNAKTPRKWILRPTGGMYNFTAATVSFGIANVKEGQVIKIEWTTSSYGSVTVNSGITQLESISYGSTGYYTVNSTGTVYFNAARNVYIKNIYVYDTSVSKTITDAGWATYCSPYALDFSGDIANLTNAYIVTGATGATLNLTSVKGGKVAPNTGILIEGTEGPITIPVATSGTDYSSSNKLIGKTAAYELAANGGYVLLNGDKGVGFYINPTATFTVGANTAYLPANFASGARSAYFFGGITGVENVEAAAEAKAQEGKFVENGKLVIVKNGKKFNAAGAILK